MGVYPCFEIRADGMRMYGPLDATPAFMLCAELPIDDVIAAWVGGRVGILERTSQSQQAGLERRREGRGGGDAVAVAVEAAAALRGLEEVVDGEVGGGDADGELEAVAAAGDLDDVEPEEEDLDGDAAEAREVARGDAAGDGALVAERVGALDGELADVYEITFVANKSYK
uniref:Uncharacterized protein n=1 Tax=Oryza meridionalis TaxID=40149 RepID=A0A0E0DQH4_9ORYZ